MTRRFRQLKRRPARFAPRPKILVVCEGEVTEPCYLSDLKQHLQIRILDIQIEGAAGVPKSLVEYAVELKRNAEKRAAGAEDDNLQYDEVWCLFDVDEHPKIAEALDQAKANNIKVALSVPCFELWLLLHFQDQRAHIERGPIHHLCKKHMPKYEKRADFSVLKEHIDLAVQRARQLEAWQRNRGCDCQNPWTQVHELVAALKETSKDEFIKRLRTHC